MPQPSSKKDKLSAIDRKAYSAKTRRIKTAPKSKTPVFTGKQARDAQNKQSKKYYKNPMDTSSSSRYS